MAQLFLTLAVYAVVHGVDGAYICPSGYDGKSGQPKCGGAVDSTCSTATCCDPVPTCTSFSTAWAAAQLLGSGCAADGATKFFDLKKANVEVASPRGKTEVKAACCTPFAQAKCSDWAAILGSCPSGKAFVGTNAAPADGSNGKTLSKTKYHESCCITQPKQCSSFSVAWATAQLLGSGCAANGATNFFDLKKAKVQVASPGGDAEVKAACCTPFAQAKCSDWALIMGSCPSGKTFVGTNSAPADGSNGKTISKTKYRDSCCVTQPKKCSSYSVAWAAAQLLGSGCAANGATNFFDLKKAKVQVASPGGDAEVKAACCTPFAQAKCSDWAAILGSCPSGKSFVGTNSAPADSSDGKTLSKSKYQDSCCMMPMKCADYTGSETSSAFQTTSVALWLAVTGLMVA